MQPQKPQYYTINLPITFLTSGKNAVVMHSYCLFIPIDCSVINEDITIKQAKVYIYIKRKTIVGRIVDN